jgi:hypothetical protein
MAWIERQFRSGCHAGHHGLERGRMIRDHAPSEMAHGWVARARERQTARFDLEDIAHHGHPPKHRTGHNRHHGR